MVGGDYFAAGSKACEVRYWDDAEEAALTIHQISASLSD